MRVSLLALAAACGSSGHGAIDGAPPPGDAPLVVDVLSPAVLPYRGTNLSGAEFGGTVPGSFGTDYIYPDPAYATGYTSADYFLARHMTVFRLPFLWERLQRTLGGDLDADELARLDTTVSDLTTKGAFVLVDPHDFARYAGKIIGSADVPDSAFADLWARLATHFASNAHVIFGLMNEPHDLPTEQWRDAANAAIAAIRGAGAHQLILVPGNAWTGAWSWTQSFYGTANATAMLDITDPEDHYAYEVHQYLDSDYSGTHTTCQSATIGAESLASFTQWLSDHGKRGLLGEFGASSDPSCLSAIDGMLAHIKAHDDVWLGWTWWSAGPWWGSGYFQNLEPAAGSDVPQMTALAPYL